MNESFNFDLAFVAMRIIMRILFFNWKPLETLHEFSLSRKQCRGFDDVLSGGIVTMVAKWYVVSVVIVTEPSLLMRTKRGRGESMDFCLRASNTGIIRQARTRTLKMTIVIGKPKMAVGQRVKGSPDSPLSEWPIAVPPVNNIPQISKVISFR